MKIVSIGIAKCEIDGIDLGSCISSTIETQLTTIGTHTSKVGSAKIVPSEYKVKRAAGVMSIAVEEISIVRSILDDMLSVLNGEPPVKKPFTCSFPLSGGSISGQVLMLPQFSATVSVDGWSSITIQPTICSELTATSGSNMPTVVGGVPFMDTKVRGAATLDTDNLCCGVTCNSLDVGELNISVSCQSTGIYRNASPWPIDYVIDIAQVTADIGFYTFEALQTYFDTDQTVIITFNTIGGTSVNLNFGDKCSKILSGMKTSTSGINTWHVKIEGNSF